MSYRTKRNSSRFDTYRYCFAFKVFWLHYEYSTEVGLDYCKMPYFFQKKILSHMYINTILE